MLKTTPEYSVGRLRDFASLPLLAVRSLDEMLVPSPQTRGAILYTQGNDPSNVYILFAGKVKLTAVLAKGRTALLRIAESGELLGLNAVMAKRPYIATARVMEASQIAFIPKEEFVSLMERYPDLAIAIAERLAHDCTEALCEMLFLRVTSSTVQRLATLILRWSAATRTRRNGIPILYTQAEVGQMIGASRETVTRLMKQLERAGDICVSDSKLKIVNRPALENIARIHSRQGQN